MYCYNNTRNGNMSLSNSPDHQTTILHERNFTIPRRMKGEVMNLSRHLEIGLWCEKNLSGRWCLEFNSITDSVLAHFSEDGDLMLFNLKWS